MKIGLTKEVGDGQDAQRDRDVSCQHHLSKAERPHNGTSLPCSSHSSWHTCRSARTCVHTARPLSLAHLQVSIPTQKMDHSHRAAIKDSACTDGGTYGNGTAIGEHIAVVVSHVCGCRRGSPYR